jgi:superfamily I DNA/RNA helicase
MAFRWWTSIAELDEFQSSVVSLPPKGDFLITGPPGSGKTNLLALRARYLVMSGTPNVVILTFTRSLNEFLKTGVGNYSLPSGVVRTYASWVRQLMREYDQKIEDSDNFEQARANLLDALEQLCKNPNVEGAFDCILLDEAQDYSASEIRGLRYLAKNIYAAADSEQQIYAGRDGLAELRGFCDEKHLPYNYRNAPEICRVADAVLNKLDNPSGLESTSNNTDKFVASVKPVMADNLAQQSINVIESVRTQLAAYPGEAIGILAARNDTLSELVESLSNSDLADLFQHQSSQAGYAAIDDNKPIVVATIHNAKGLEFRAVHVVNTQDLANRTLSHNLAYTAFTRAKTSLSLHYSGALPGFIESALASLDSHQPPGDLRVLFGRAE